MPDNLTKEDKSKGGQATGPRKNGFMREQLEKYIFADDDDKTFKEWVGENYTDAIKELVKLQPKQIGGDPDGVPIELKWTVEVVETEEE